MSATAHYPCPDCGTLLPVGQSALLCPVCALHEAAEAETEIQGYTLLHEIARGGMGVVYEAQQRSLQRTVALKILPGAVFSSGEYRQRFQREAETAAQLNHPGIVTVHEVGTHQGQPFIAMEMIRGPSLAEVLQAGPLKPKQAAELIHAVALALVHAHEKQVIHRDLKPSNILLRKANEPVLTDFGLARFIFTGQTLTQESQSLGSPGYLPPERVEGLDSGPSFSEDVYGLGAVLYHCLTGRPPFVAETVAAILAATTLEEPTSPRVLNPNVPRDLETVCLRCLEKKPRARYASAAELADELARYLRGEPVLTRPVGPLTRLLKKARRQPVLTALSVALVLAVLLGFTASLLGWRSAARESAQRRVELYSSQVSAAGAALMAYHPSQARILLSSLEPRAGEADLRGPEWVLLKFLLEPQEYQQLPAHGHILTSLAWSPDGKSLLSGAHHGSVKLWKLQAGNTLSLESELIAPGQPRLHQLAWAGSDTFLSAEQRRFICCRSVTQPSKVLWQLPGAQFSYCTAKRLLAVSEGGPFQNDLPGPLQLWQLPADDSAPQLLRSFPVKYRAVALSATGRWLASSTSQRAGDDSERGLQLWDLSQPTASPRQLPTRGSVWSLNFSPDEQQLLVFMSRGDVWLQRYEPSSGRELSPLTGHQLRPWAAAFSPDGTVLTTGSDRTLRSWKDGVQTALASAAHENEIWSAALHPQQQLLATGDKDGVLKLFPYPLPPSRLDSCPRFSHRHYEPLHYAADSSAILLCPPKPVHLQQPLDSSQPQAIPSRGRLLGSDTQGRLWQWYEGKVQIWDGKNFTTHPTPSVLHQLGKPVRAFLVKGSSQCTFIFRDSSVARWDLQTQQILTSPPLLSEPLAKNQFFQVTQISPDGRYVAVANWHHLSLYDFSTGQQQSFANDPHWAKDIAFSPSGDQFATAGVNGHILVRRLSDGMLLHTLTGHLEEASGLAYSPDGHALVSTEIGVGLRFWRTDTWRQVLHLPLADAAESLTFSPDGRWLAVMLCLHGNPPDAGKVILLRTGL